MTFELEPQLRANFRFGRMCTRKVCFEKKK